MEQRELLRIEQLIRKSPVKGYFSHLGEHDRGPEIYAHFGNPIGPVSVQYGLDLESADAIAAEIVRQAEDQLR
jgi:hypothetical protein